MWNREEHKIIASEEKNESGGNHSLKNMFFSLILKFATRPEDVVREARKRGLRIEGETIREQVLKVLRPLTPGKLTVLFGSAGERDVSKRPMQGEIAARLADFAIFTNEDPRLEDENKIIDEIAGGAERQGWQEGRDFLKIADRRSAIEAAFKLSRPGDTVLLAGKGHEQCIIVGTEKVPWDERDEARAALEKLLTV